MRLPSVNGLTLLPFLLFLAVVPPVCGEEVAPLSAESMSEEGDIFLPPWVDRYQLATVSTLMKLSENLDSFFPNPDNTRFDYNKTRLLVRFGLQQNTQGSTTLLQRVSARIALPRLEERLSLFFSEDDYSADDSKKVDEMAVFVPSNIETDAHLGVTTGVSVVFAKSEFYKIQNRLGVRLYPEWRPFDEFGGFLNIPLGRFLLKPGQILFWRDLDGFGETTLVDLDRPLGGNLLLRLHSQGTVSEITSGLEYREALHFFHQISAKKGYSLILEASGATKPQNRFNAYLAGISWKQRIHKEWLFIETGVSVEFQRDDSFRPLPAIFFALVVDFNGRHYAVNPSKRIAR